MDELPPGWTRHIAPSGHYYYHQEQAGQSQYERPQWQQAVGAAGKRDRAVQTQPIPSALPWLLVLTERGRKFVHQPESRISLWLPTLEVQQALDAMGPMEKAFGESGSGSGGEREEDSDSESDRDGSGDGEGGAIGFDEEDIAWQLEQMAETQPGMDLEMEATMEEKRGVFEEMLTERTVSPYNTWDMHMDALVSDPRYLALENTKERRLVYDAWSKRQIAHLQETKHLQPKQDRRLDFLRYIIPLATKKLFWPEFRRRHKKQPAIDKWLVPDREKETLYRQVVEKRKLPPDQQLAAARHATPSEVAFLILPAQEQERLKSDMAVTSP